MTIAPTSSTLRVDLDDRSYDIVIGFGLIHEAGARIAALVPHPRVVIVTDENVAPHYLPPLEASLKAAGIHVESITLPAGEHSKSFAQLQFVCETLLEMKVERTTTLIALGGGVIGDLVGFTAAITLRGLPFIQVPTTLLGQVDSSVGGKTGINTPFGKNLVGAFYQPKLVLADIGTLETLDLRQMRAGYAEVVKYGCIDDLEFFTWLEKNGPDLIAGDPDLRRHAVLTSCAAKARVVAEDEREIGARALLNLGHTFGHALEAETGYGDALLHGEAVAIGTAFAFNLSQHLGFCAASDVARATAHLEAVGLPVDLTALDTTEWSVDTLMNHMSRDKKVEGGALTFILTRGIGAAFIARNVNEDAVRDVVEHWLETKTF